MGSVETLKENHASLDQLIFPISSNYKQGVLLEFIIIYEYDIIISLCDPAGQSVPRIQDKSVDWKVKITREKSWWRVSLCLCFGFSLRLGGSSQFRQNLLGSRAERIMKTIIGLSFFIFDFWKQLIGSRENKKLPNRK